MIEPCTARLRWNEFLRSEAFKTVKQHYSAEVRDPESPSQSHQLLRHWQRALTTACILWHFQEEEREIIDTVVSTDAKEERLRWETWKTIVFLMKGACYVRHGLPLCHLEKDTTGSDFVLHAAVDSLAFCTNPDSSEMAIGGQGSTSALFVFRQVIRKYHHQLAQVGPFLGRFPIQIAAANSSASADFHVSSRDADLGCSLEILEVVLSNCPHSLLTRKDSAGMFPLHLAAAAGCPWQAGLRAILSGAPEVLDDTSLPPPFELAAERAGMDTLFQLIRVSPHTLELAMSAQGGVGESKSTPAHFSKMRG